MLQITVVILYHEQKITQWNVCTTSWPTIAWSQIFVYNLSSIEYIKNSVAVNINLIKPTSFSVYHSISPSLAHSSRVLQNSLGFPRTKYEGVLIHAMPVAVYSESFEARKISRSREQENRTSVSHTCRLAGVTLSGPVQGKDEYIMIH